MGTLGQIRINPLTKDFLREVFEYDEANGGLKWLPKIPICQENRRWNTRYAGKPAGSPNNEGYYHVKIWGKKYKLHRLVFLYFNGFLPEVVDHKDGDKSNNRIQNLREANRQSNNYNSKIGSGNTSGVKGVSWHKQHKKWYATIRFERKPIFLGLFDNKHEAEACVIAARKTYHKEFANNG